MAEFPKSFAEKVEFLDAQTDIGKRGKASLAALQEKGFRVAIGLTTFFAGAVSITAQQPHIREYCPRDSTRARFATEASTRRWLTKGGGRAMFLLLNEVVEKGVVAGHQLAGYGWTGVERNDKLPDHPITSAYRLGESALRQGLSGDFVQTVVSATNAFIAPGEGIGLETWASNGAASLYPKVGFELQPNPDARPEPRPTLDRMAVDGTVMDTRLYMGYPAALLG